MRTKGKISFWNDQKGYGFIQPMDGGKRVFVHIKAFGNRAQRPEEGQVVTYTLSADAKGRPRAIDAVRPRDRKPRKSNSFETRFGSSLPIVLVFLGCLILATVFAHTHVFVLPAIVVLSGITLSAYAIDKSAAMNGRSRISENTLHMLSLAGGWPGALLAQQKFRHKSRKQPFRTIFWLTVIVNCGVLLWLSTPGGVQDFGRMIRNMV